MAQGVYYVSEIFCRTSKAQGTWTKLEFGSLGVAYNLAHADNICRQKILLHMKI